MIRAADTTELLPAAGPAPDAEGPLTDEDLMLRYRHGDASAFDLLYARHRTGLYRFILRQCPHRGEVDEIFQDVWMNLINARARYQPSAKFRTFLFQIARNRVIDIARRSRDDRLVSIDDDHEGAGSALADRLHAPRALEPDAIAERGAAARDLQLAIATLPFVQREALLLHEDGGLSLDEIAALTGTQRETVKSRLRYALGRLRAHFSATAAGRGERS